MPARTSTAAAVLTAALGAAAGVFLTVAPGLALAAEPPAVAPKTAAEIDPASPRGAMKAFYEGMEASDAAAVRSLFYAATDDEKQLADAYAAVLTSARALGEAARTKFGATGDALSKGMPVKDEIAKLRTAKEVVSGNAATIEFPARPDGARARPLKLVKGEGGRWRLAVGDYAGATPATIGPQVKVLRDMSGAFDAVAADIVADKFPAAPDAQRVLQTKLQAILFNVAQKNPPTSAPSTARPPK